jgi:tetratricopeptide (TPR) repeat protein
LLQAEALLQTSRGDHASAEQLARQAVSWAARSDSLSEQGDSLSTLAEVLEAASRREDAIATWQDALDRYERKRIVPLARRTRERIAALETR